MEDIVFSCTPGDGNCFSLLEPVINLDPLFAWGYSEVACSVDDGGLGNRDRKGYQTDVTDEGWAFVAPYLALCRDDATQRDYPLRAVLNAVRYVAKSGCPWRMLPNDLPPWYVVYQQMRRWMEARCFETMVEDLRQLLREYAGRKRHIAVARKATC